MNSRTNTDRYTICSTLERKAGCFCYQYDRWILHMQYTCSITIFAFTLAVQIEDATRSPPPRACYLDNFFRMCAHFSLLLSAAAASGRRRHWSVFMARCSTRNLAGVFYINCDDTCLYFSNNNSGYESVFPSTSDNLARSFKCKPAPSYLVAFTSVQRCYVSICYIHFEAGYTPPRFGH